MYATSGGAGLAALRFFLRKKSANPQITAMTTIAPTTIPAIAPRGIGDGAEVGGPGDGDVGKDKVELVGTVTGVDVGVLVRALVGTNTLT